MTDGVLFVHWSFPGQFSHLAQALVARGVPCAAVGHHHADDVPGVDLVRYALPRGSTPGVYAPAMAAEGDFIRGSIAFQAAQGLKAQGFDPAVIVGHAHWGETVFLKELFPDARQVIYPEYFSQAKEHAAAFDPEFQPSGLQAQLLAKAKPAVMALELCDADAIVVPTAFQAATLPAVFQPRVRIIHEGVDTEALKPEPGKELTLADWGVTIRPGDPVITHVNNFLEPLRGLHILARALPKVLAAVPEARVLISGHARKGGGYTGASEEEDWKARSLKGVDLDMSRVHFLGWTDHAFMHEALRVSTAHVYYTYPFVLSWSVIEAMALGCYIVASDTAPLHDAIEDGVNGRLLPFFDVDALSDTLIEACRNPEASAAMRRAARRTAVERFDRKDSLSAWFGLLREMGLEIP